MRGGPASIRSSGRGGPADEVAKRGCRSRDVGREPGAELKVRRDDAEQEDLLSRGLEELAAEREGELMGGIALDFGEVGQGTENDGTRRPFGGHGVDEDDVTAVVAGDDVDEIFGDVLSVDQTKARSRDGGPDGSDDPGTDPVIMAQRVADPDETGRFPEELGEGGPAGDGIETARVGGISCL